MTMNLKMTRRTWYALLLTAAACSLLAGFAAFAGQQLGLLDQLAFGATALAALFLAAEKGSPKQEKTGYFGVFVLLMLAYVAGAPLAHLFGAAVWPLLLAVERRRGMPVAQPLRLVCFAEAPICCCCCWRWPASTRPFLPTCSAEPFLEVVLFVVV